MVHGSSQAPFVARRIRLLHHIFWSDVCPHHIAVKSTVDRRRKERFEFGGVGKAFPGNGSDIIVVDVRLHRELVCTADGDADVVLVDLGSEVVALVGEVVARLFEQPEALLVLPNALIHTARLFVVTEHAELEHVSFVQIDGKGKGVKLPFDRFKIVLVGVQSAVLAPVVVFEVFPLEVARDHPGAGILFRRTPHRIDGRILRDFGVEIELERIVRGRVPAEELRIRLVFGRPFGRLAARFDLLRFQNGRLVAVIISDGKGFGIFLTAARAGDESDACERESR